MQDNNLTSENFWNKISGISFVFSLMILFLHNTSNLQYFGDADYRSYPPLELAVFWIRNNLAYLALSSFFLISGFLMFRDFILENCRMKIRRRITSLALPFFAWNIISMVEEILVSNMPFVRAQMVRHPPFEMNLTNVLHGFIRGKGTWYLLALILLALLSPLVYFVIKNKKSGLLLIVGLYLCDFFSVPGFELFHGADNVCFYVTGAFIGKHYFTTAQKRATPWVQWGSGTFFICVMCFLFVAKHILSVSWFTIPFISMMSISFWFAYDCLRVSNSSWLKGASMFIYVSHFHIEPYIVKVVYLALPKQPQYCIPNFVVSGTITACLCLLLFVIMRARFPKTLSVLTGGR